jgi:hypothetical protein
VRRSQSAALTTHRDLFPFFLDAADPPPSSFGGELDTVVAIHQAILKFEAASWQDKTPR